MDFIWYLFYPEMTVIICSVVKRTGTAGGASSGRDFQEQKGTKTDEKWKKEKQRKRE